MSGAAVAIGAFDGVHRGHQRVLDALKTTAKERGLSAVVITFEPLPREFLMGDAAPGRVQPLRDRVAALRAAGIDRICCLRFNHALQHEPAEGFVQRLLQGRLQAQVVVAGADFHFGHRRAGDAALLRASGLDFVAVPQLDVDGERVSSTRLRAALAAADLEQVAAMLGRPYAVSGRVRRGDARGRQLGFPTANLVPARPLALADGVYAVRVGDHFGAAHSGTRAWLGGTERRLEVHLLDFSGDLYGQHLTVQFEQFIRADREFGSLDELQACMAVDMDAVRDTIRARD